MNTPVPPQPRSLPSSVRHIEAPGQLPHLEISTPSATAQVFLHGAHVARWQPSHADAPVLWMSGHSFWQDGKPIRGGVPICFPWFGPHRSDPAAPAHGFARLVDWALLDAAAREDGRVWLALGLEGSRMSSVWPFHFAATLEIEVGTTLSMTLEVENRDPAAMTFEEALHTYLAVSDVAGVTITGLERTAYLDKAGGLTRRTQDDTPVRFSGETDRVYLDTTAACAVEDPGLRRRIVVSKEHSRTTVVWNPWIAKARAMQDFGDDEWHGMVCVETANAGNAAVHLAPGERHRMSVSLAVEPL